MNDVTPPTVVEQPLACIGCGYNLFRLPVVGTCPECGRLIKDSSGPERLPLHDQRYVRRLRIGFGLLALEGGLVFGSMAVALLAAFLSLFGVRVETALEVALYAASAAAIPWVFGCLLSTTLPSEMVGYDNLRALRRSIRWWMPAKLGPVALLLSVMLLDERIDRLLLLALIWPSLPLSVYVRGVVLERVGCLVRLAAISVSQTATAATISQGTATFLTSSRLVTLALVAVMLLACLAMLPHSDSNLSSILLAVLALPVIVLLFVWYAMAVSFTVLLAQMSYKLRTGG